MNNLSRILSGMALAAMFGCGASREEVQRLETEVARQRSRVEEERSKYETLRAAEAQNAEVIADATQRLSRLISRKIEVDSRIVDAQRSLEVGAPVLLPPLGELISAVESQIREAEIEVSRLQRMETLAKTYREVLGQYQEVIASTKREIAGLRIRLEEIEQERDHLASEVGRQRSRIVVLEESADGLSQAKSQLEQRVSEYAEDVKSGFLLVAESAELKRIEARGQLIKKWQLLVPAPNLLQSRSSSDLLTRVEVSKASVVLPGRWRGAEVESIHKYFSNLFDVREVDRRQWSLALRDPAAFWGVSRYLIVRVDS